MTTRTMDGGRQIETCMVCGCDLLHDAMPALFGPPGVGSTCRPCGEAIRRNVADPDAAIARSKAASLLGKLGGAAGRGEAKRRGDSEHYRALVARRQDRIAKADARAKNLASAVAAVLGHHDKRTS